MICLASCSAAPAPIVNAVPPPVANVEAIDVSLNVFRWRVRGNEPGKPFTFHYCCMGGGVAETPIALTAGHWLLRVNQTSDECYTAIHPSVSHGETWISTPTAATERWAATLVDVPARLADEPLRLRIFVEGGKECCGTSTIDKVELVQSP